MKEDNNMRVIGEICAVAFLVYKCAVLEGRYISLESRLKAMELKIDRISRNLEYENGV